MVEIFVSRDLHFKKGGQGCNLYHCCRYVSMLLHKYVPVLFHCSIFEKNMEQEVVQDKDREYEGFTSMFHCSILFKIYI